MVQFLKKKFYSRWLFVGILVTLFCLFTIQMNRNPLDEERVLGFINIGNVSKTTSALPRIDINNEEYEKLIQFDLMKQVPGLGNGGVPVTLAGEEKALADIKYAKEAFNLVLSDKLAYNRSIDDARHPLCRTLTYNIADLPTASVVIIFTDERWSSLIRTVHSVINRSPKSLLKEIILVDDFSSHDELKGKLDYYIQTRFPSGLVKLTRMDHRVGLVRARLAGAQVSVGDVLVFLDAHCEVGIQWLEPLLNRIKQGRNNVVVPIIDVIDDKTLEYQHNGGSHSFQVGGFTWSGHFTWVDVEQGDLRNPVDATKSPTMAGGLFAIDRQYFWEMGSYDNQMDVWGGENLEMSFRIWQCGGRIETLPCSRVGHIFRSFHPYTFPGKKDTHGINTARLVEVWMDDYKRLFYFFRPDLKIMNIGELTERLELRKRLKCKSFKWYLENVFTSKFILDEGSLGYGRVKTPVNSMCVDTLGKSSEDDVGPVGIYPCHNRLYQSQLFCYSKNKEMRREFFCFQPELRYRTVLFSKCDGSEKQKWEYTKTKQFKNYEAKLCMSTANVNTSGNVRLVPCDDNDPWQFWSIEFFNTTELLS